MKRIIGLTLAFILAAGMLTGCGGGNTTNQPQSGATGTSQASESTPEPTAQP